MRNLIINIYCTRDRNTLLCPLHLAARAGNNLNVQSHACLNCEHAMIEFTQSGKNLSERGLPRLTPSTNLSNYEE